MDGIGDKTKINKKIIWVEEWFTSFVFENSGVILLFKK